ncbi:hypothetical protein, conserved [Eimeria tenella]|uniref:WD domain, G-beta repeat-containing protein n=1 Tax=Eimeria tenella TaxID=5802 RepID=U6KS16_EIMTE|nr:hypothetical protein, conserved [Eimeria tenella]CDJ38223.1 hypothetical protein, conserved [Eimeria tenella]|eukprot:XP_013229061.1 hypothetical protein, conserved [Eimeria tenella]
MSEATSQGNGEASIHQAPRRRRDGTHEATLLHESSAHRDAVLSLDLCEAATDAAHPDDASLPKANGHVRWILSVGTDRVVKAWSVDLQRLGQLTSVRFINSQRHALAVHSSYLSK